MDGDRQGLGKVGARLRLARRLRGLKLKALAEKVGCSESLLSKYETGKAMPSLPMLHRLARARGFNIGWMFEEDEGDAGIVFRAGERPMIALDPLRKGEGITLERVVPYDPGHLVQCNIHHIAAGGKSDAPISHDGEEVGYVIEGEIELEVDGRVYRLSAGDAFVFRSTLPHAYRNPTDRAASIFWVNTPPTF
jgi:quercetin dioxygenase-like cupin family protein/DNA-binding XRE family transcriptional regulator